jgi:hypothetical protein
VRSGAAGAGTHHAGARLVLPPDAVTVPGRFPLNSVVKFNVPLRDPGFSTVAARLAARIAADQPDHRAAEALEPCADSVC